MPSLPASIAAYLGVVCLVFLLLALWAVRTRHRRLAALSVAGSLLAFLPIWWTITVALVRYFVWVLASAWSVQTYSRLTWASMVLIVAAFFGIFSVWAALGRPHWFLRILLVGGLLGLILVSPVFLSPGDPVEATAFSVWLVYLFQSAITILGLALARHLAGWTWGPDGPTASTHTCERRLLQFGLRDLLLLMLLVAAVLAIASFAPKGTWGSPSSRNQIGLAMLNFVLYNHCLHLGASLGVATVAAAWVALGRSPAWLRAMGLLVAWPLFPCLLWLRLWRACLRRRERRISRGLAWSSLFLGSALIVVPTAILLWRFTVPPPIPRPPFVESAETDFLERLAEPLHGHDIPQSHETPARLAEMTAFAAEHRSVFDDIHAALRQPHYQSPRYRDDDWCTDLNRNSASRRLARVLFLDAVVAAEEHRNADALRSCEDLLRLAQSTRRGRVFVDIFNARGIEARALETLQRMASSLDADQCRQAIQMLDDYDRAQEPSDAFIQREQAWMAHALGPLGRLHAMAERMTDWFGYNDLWRRIRWRVLSYQTGTRSMMAVLALQGYRSEHGQYPTRLDELVPAYLPQVPVDPTTNQPLAYQRTDEGFQISSPALSKPWTFPVAVPPPDAEQDNQ